MMTGTYNMGLVLLSYLVAVTASYTALELAKRVASSQGKAAVIWLIAGAFSMGIGIWTMHFVGMLAFSMAMPFSYDMPITILSLLIGGAASAFAIFVASRKRNTAPKICLAGLILGCGIAGMHYTGMAAMRMEAVIVYDTLLVATSIVIAVVAAIAAIWIVFTLINISSKYLLLLKVGAAFIMGLAICGMHYTGMLAAKYQPIAGATMSHEPGSGATLMAITLSIAALLILSFTLFTVFFDYRLGAEKNLGEKLTEMVKERTAALELQAKELLRSKESLEQEIRQRAEAEKEVLYLSEVLDESSNEIYIFAPETLLFVKVNKGAINNSGFDESEFVSMTLLDLMQEYTEQSFAALLEPLRRGQKNHLVYESLLKRKDGSSYPVQVHLQLCRTGGRAIFVASITDVSELKNIEQQLRQAQKMESIGQLAAGMAHEINTPSQYIGDNIQFLKEGFSDLMTLHQAHARLLESVKNGTVEAQLLEQTAEAVEQADIDYLGGEIPVAIDQSLSGIAHISKIVCAMKEFSHPGEKNRELCDLNKVIGTAITVSSSEWKYAAEIETHLDDSLPAVPCFAQEVTQVLINLIVNAAHAISDASNGKGKGLIQIRTRQTDHHAEIQLSDSGCGIPENIRERIFEPFFTTKEVGRGSGQGLAMVYTTIVDKHCGSLDVVSEEEKGATFTIRLPLDKFDSLNEAG